MAGDTYLIAAIYDAVIDPSGWDQVVKRIIEATKSVSGGLHITHMDPDKKGGLYVIRILSKGEVKVSPHWSATLALPRPAW